MEVSTATLCKLNFTLETLSNPACNCDSEREWDWVYHLKPSVIALLSFIVSSRTRKYFKRPRCINCKSRLRDGGPDVWNDDWSSHSSRPCCKRSSAEPASLNKHFLCGHFILNIPILRKSLEILKYKPIFAWYSHHLHYHDATAWTAVSPTAASGLEAPTV